MRWTIVILGLALGLAVVAGCKQPLFNVECDIDHYRNMPALPPNVDEDPNVSNSPSPYSLLDMKPADVLDPDRPIRYISLQECIAIGLEQGTNLTSGQNGQWGDQTPLIGFRPVEITDAMRVFALEPAKQAAEIDHALSRFDASWVSSMTWSFTDQPFGGSQFAFLGGQNLLAGTSRYQATPTTGLIKPLPTGGTAGITFSVPYTDQNPAFGRLNPAYAPLLHFGFEQPLLQGFGVEINQIRGQHPGAILDQFLQGAQRNTRDGILLARIRYDQNRANFEGNVQNYVANVEAAYWRLYGAYAQLYSREQALIQALAAWRVNNNKLQAGVTRKADEAQARGQYELFRGDRLEALGQVLEAERQLRGFLSLPMNDNTRLVPSDQPTIAPYLPDWRTAQMEALNLSPHIILAREQLKLRQLELIAQRNFLLPDVRFTGQYEINSLGSSLDGAGTENAFRNLASNRFNNWTLGLQANVPIGYRDAFANTRIARLNLAQAYYTLRDTEYRTTRYLTLQYRLVLQQYELIKSRRAQREAFAEQLKVRFELFRQGVQQQTLDVLLESQRFWADAFAREAQAIVDYNVALANFELAKGTILLHNNITIGEGPLPACAAVRASEHLEQRTRALVLLERAVPHLPVDGDPASPVMGKFTPGVAPSLPSLMMGAPKLENDDLDYNLGPTQGPTLPSGVEPIGSRPSPHSGLPTYDSPARANSAATRSVKADQVQPASARGEAPKVEPAKVPASWVGSPPVPGQVPPSAEKPPAKPGSAAMPQTGLERPKPLPR